MDNKKAKIIIKIFLFLLIISVEIFLYCIVAILICFLNEMINFQFSHFTKYLFKPTTIALGVLIIILSLGYFIYFYFKKKKTRSKANYNRTNQKLYDDARFLTPIEMNEFYGDGDKKNKKGGIAYENACKYDINGLIISSYINKNNYYFYRANDVHNLIVGTTGTGKTKFLLIPTIMMMAKSKNKPSTIVLDIKGEIIEKTYYTLKTNNYNVHIIDLRNPELSERYNPLDIIINYFNEYLTNKTNRKALFQRDSEIGKLVNLVCPINKGEDKFWDLASQSILKSIIFGLLEDYESGKITKEQFTFASIFNINTLDSKELKDFFKRRKNDRNSKCYKEAQSNFLNHFDSMGEMDNTLRSMWSTYATAFNKFIDEACLEITLRSDFDIAKIREEPYSLFILLPDEDTSRYPLATLIINQIYSTLVNLSQKEGIKGKRDICYILDEFANLPKFENINNWLSVGRERKMFISIFIQSLSQLEDKYGKDYAKTIIQNCNMKIILGLGETDSVDYFKRLFGTYTVVTQSSSSGYSSKSGSTNDTLSKADLVNSTEFQLMETGEIYFIELKKHPAHAKVIPIFDETFTNILNYDSFDLNNRSDLSFISDDERELYIYDPAKEIKEDLEKRQKRINIMTNDSTSSNTTSNASGGNIRNIEHTDKEKIKDEYKFLQKRIEEYETDIPFKVEGSTPNSFTIKSENENKTSDVVKTDAISNFMFKKHIDLPVENKITGKNEIVKDEEIKEDLDVF